MLQAVKQEEIFIPRKFSCPKPEEGFLFPWVLFVLLLFPVQPVFDLEWRRVLLVIGFESLFLFSEAFSVYNEYSGACGSGKEYI